MKDDHAERIATALERIAFHLSEDGAVGEALYLIHEMLEEAMPEPGERARRALRTLDIAQ